MKRQRIHYIGTMEIIETHLPVYCVFVSFADVGNRSSHNVVGGGVDMVPMVRMHGMVYYG